MAEKNKPLIAKRFSRCSDQYESVTPVQSQMADRLIDRVQRQYHGGTPDRVLELGCGTGRLSRRILEVYPNCQLTAIDIAPDMIAKAKATVSGAEFIVADAETFWQTVDRRYDLIISNATVQWFETPGETMQAYLACLSDHGLLAVATFAEETFRELQASFQHAYAERGLPLRKHVHDLPSKGYWEALLPAATVEDDYYSLDFPDVRSFLRSIQKAGATHSGGGASRLTPSLYRSMAATYKENYGVPGTQSIRATYHALYIMLNADR